MSRRKKPGSRCEQCQMRKELCLCADIATLRQQIDITTRICVLMHYREYFGTTNTARLARLVLPKCETLIRGRPDTTLDPAVILPQGYDHLVLYPSLDAVDLIPDFVRQRPRPINLIVPDGSWRQASKVPKREVALLGVPCVRLPTSEPSRYLLRREPKSGGLATFEAISRALGILEGPSVQAGLDGLFAKMVERTLASRGTLKAAGLQPVDPDDATEEDQS